MKAFAHLGLVVLLGLFYTTGIAQRSTQVRHLLPEDGLSYRWATSVQQDSLGFIWVTTYDGFNRYDGHRFTVFRPELSHASSGQHIHNYMHTFYDSEGQFWLNTEGRKWFRFDPLTQELYPAQIILSETADTLRLQHLFKSPDGQLWGMGQQEDDQVLARWQTGMHFEPILTFRTAVDGFDQLAYADNQHLWFRNATAFLFFDVEQKTLREYPFREITAGNTAYPDLPIDAQGQCWFPKGDRLHPLALPTLTKGDDWEEIEIDNKGNLWLITQDRHYFRYSEGQAQAEYIGHFDFIQFGILSPFEDEEGNIWLPHFYGLSQIQMDRDLFDNYLHRPLDELGNARNAFSTYNLFELDDTTLLVRIAYEKQFGIRLNVKTGDHEQLDLRQEVELTKAELLAKLDSSILNSLQQRIIELIWTPKPEVEFWVSVRNQPAQFFDFRRRILWKTRLIEKGIYALPFDEESHRYYPLFDQLIRFFCVHSQGDSLWLGTDQGLYSFHPEKGTLHAFTTADGLPHNIIYTILSDGPVLWLGTHNGLCRFDTRNGQTKTYYVEDGLTHNEFNRVSALRTKDGRMYFGGLNGINAFYPAALEQQERRHRGRLLLTGFSKIDGRTDSLQQRSGYQLSNGALVRLHPEDRSLHFEFALTSFSNPSQNKYLYYLDGWEEPWSNATTEGEATYLHLPPGEYTLRVKATDPFGNPAQNEIALPLLMPQVWYLRWWAFAAYALLLAGVLVAVYRYQLKRRLMQEETERLRAMDEIKSRFYANITHEFRTPLTLILGLAEEADRHRQHSGLHARTVDMIRRNGKHLLQLVNQILELSKIESQSMTLHLVQTDFIKFVRYLLESFQWVAAAKNIELKFRPEPEEMLMDFDVEKMNYLLANLLSNAIKFTPEGGQILVQTTYLPDAEKPHLKLQVSDTGIGIPPDKLPYIFERFYQVDDSSTRTAEGTGIGLALVRELVQLMQGRIEVESQAGEGTTFLIHLPVTRQAPLQKDVALESTSAVGTTADWREAELPAPDGERPLLLIAEDNPDVVFFLKMVLQSLYDIVVAGNGAEAEEQALEIIPDLIISDVMMPLMDGYELCRTLKTDTRTSHIPIILLTAKASEASRLKGLEQGADVYLSKPFNRQELLLHLRNLLELRQAMQRKFAEEPELPLHEIASSPTDKVFLRKVQDLIEHNMANEQFSVSDMAVSVNLSERTLRRKIKALTDQSPVQFIRTCRLNRAHQLLRKQDQTVSEISFAVGFSDPLYFSKCFKEQFGYSPSEVAYPPSGN